MAWIRCAHTAHKGSRSRNDVDPVQNKNSYWIKIRLSFPLVAVAAWNLLLADPNYIRMQPSTKARLRREQAQVAGY